MSRVWRFTTNSSGSFSPRVRSRVQCVSIDVGMLASQMIAQCAPPSDRPSTAFGCSQHLAQRVERVVRVVVHRDHEQVVGGPRDDHVVEHLGRRAPGARRDVADALLERRLVVDGVGERPDAVRHALEQRRRARRVGLGEDRRAHGRVAQAARACSVGREAGHRGVAGPALERVVRRVEAEQQAGRAARRPGERPGRRRPRRRAPRPGSPGRGAGRCCSASCRT